MRILYTLFLVFAIQVASFGQTSKPKLVVGIVVDQMRQDYLLRFADKYGDDGFKRMMKDGTVAYNAHYNYIPTNTGPGHASVYTGTTPSMHGIISNNWYNKETKSGIYCVEDNNYAAVGGDEGAGKISPANLVTTTITDELKLSSSFKSKVIGVAIKDRGSVLPAGHNPDCAYWYDSETGNFMTSTYYLKELPGWVNSFNKEKKAEKYMKNKWELSFPLEQYTESRADDNTYENLYGGLEKPTFPYDLPGLSKKGSALNIIRATPYGNTLTLDFALAAIEGEKMGQDQITDFLAISFSSTDYVGHQFGPYSVEIEDTYIKLDREIARLLNYLDTNVGKGQYVMFISADHAVVANPQYLVDNKLPGGYINSGSIKTAIEAGVKSVCGEGDFIANISNNQLYLNHELLAEKNIKAKDVLEAVKANLLQQDNVANVYYPGELGTSGELQSTLLNNGYNAKRSGDLIYRFNPGFLGGKPGDRGTSHGTGYNYDTHIPMVFYGTGVPAKSVYRRVNITDIAPTLSMILKITLPASATGEPLTEIFE
ncbi:MAG: alkaline phosphatase PafA [Bacteroidota bacterium]